MVRPKLPIAGNASTSPLKVVENSPEEKGNKKEKTNGEGSDEFDDDEDKGKMRTEEMRWRKLGWLGGRRRRRGLMMMKVEEAEIEDEEEGGGRVFGERQEEGVGYIDKEEGRACLVREK